MNIFRTTEGVKSKSFIDLGFDWVEFKKDFDCKRQRNESCISKGEKDFVARVRSLNRERFFVSLFSACIAIWYALLFLKFSILFEIFFLRNLTFCTLTKLNKRVSSVKANLGAVGSNVSLHYPSATHQSFRT